MIEKADDAASTDVHSSQVVITNELRYVLTRFDARRKMSFDVEAKLRERLGDDVCRTRIAENVATAEGPAHQKDVFAHAPESRGAADYAALLEELTASGFIR